MPRWRNATPYLLCVPLVAFLAAFFLFPVGKMMLLSVTPQEEMAPRKASLFQDVMPMKHSGCDREEITSLALDAPLQFRQGFSLYALFPTHNRINVR